MRNRYEGEAPLLFGPSRVFRYTDMWRYRGWLTNSLIVATIVGAVALDELDVHLPYWLVSLLAAMLWFGAFGITEAFLRRQVRSEEV